MVVVAIIAAPLVFLTGAGVAVFRRRNGASIGPVLSALLAFAGGASLGVLLLLSNALDVALAAFGAAGAVAIVQWRAGRRAQAGWLLLGTGLPLTLLWAAVFLDAGRSQTINDRGAGLWLGVAAAAALVGIALVLRGDRRAPALDVAGP